MNRLRLGGRLAMLSLALCALATAVPAAAQNDDEHSSVTSMQTAPPPHVTAFAGDSVQTARPIMHVAQFVDSMPASEYYSILMALAVSVILVSRTPERRSKRMRNGGDEDDDNARAHQRTGDTVSWRHNRNALSVMSASPGGGY